MKNLTIKTLVVVMLIGTSALISRAQTTLTLRQDNTVHETGEDKILEANASVDYEIELKKDTRACLAAVWHNADANDLKATFDEKTVKSFLREDTNGDDISCFELTQDSSYSINLTNNSEESGRYELYIHSSNILAMNNGKASASGNISANTQNDFTIRLDKSKKLCFTNSSAESENLEFIFTGGQDGDEVVPNKAATSLTIYRTVNLLKIINSSPASLSYNFSIKYAETCEELIETEVFVPNVFTPNGDGNSDRLNVYGKGVASIRFKVYNRLGQIVFETDEWIEGNGSAEGQGWDGNYNGKLQESGNYTWLLSVTYINGTTAKKTGNVYLKK